MSGIAGPAAIKAGKLLHTQMKSIKGAAEAFSTSRMSDGETLVDNLKGSGAKERRRQVRCPPPPTLERWLAPHTHTSPNLFLPPLQILEHIEAEVFAAGRGDYDQCHLLMAALLERPAIMVCTTPAQHHLSLCPLDPPSTRLSRSLSPRAQLVLCMFSAPSQCPHVGYPARNRRNEKMSREAARHIRYATPHIVSH